MIFIMYLLVVYKLMKVVNEIAPGKKMRINNNMQEWFNREIVEFIHVREKLFKKFKKLHIDEEYYKKLSIKFKIFLRKRKFYETNLRQKINKPKELWKTLRSMGLPSKAVTASNICLKDKNETVFMPQKTAPFLKITFQVLHITWYLSYLFRLIFLLNLKLHPTMTITQCQKI